MTPDGPALEVVVALDAGEIASRQQAGNAVPLPLSVRAVIDTGCDVTAIAPRVLQQLGLVSPRKVSTFTAGGQVNVNLLR
jgi:hypothetical protein